MSSTYLLSDIEVNCLRHLLGCRTLSLYTPTVEVTGLSVRAPHFAIDSKRYCIVESDCQETPQEWINYHIMHETLTDHPRDVPKVKSVLGTNQMGQPVSHVELTDSSSETGLEVLEFQ